MENLVFTITTGPVTKNLKINIKDEEGRLIFEPMTFSEVLGWKYFKLDIQYGSEIFNNVSEIYVEFQDAGNQWGEWFAVALEKNKT
ncbi:MAG TPA: hypothetical protein EYO73_08630 [Sulfurimonas sp.]|nr:hypothetical protein [Sulfurimonas sp.]